MTKDQMIAETLAAAGTNDTRLALQALLAREDVSNWVTFSSQLPQDYFSGMPAARFAMMSDRDVEAYLVEAHHSL